MVISTKKVILTLFLGLLSVSVSANGQILRELDSQAAVMKELETESKKSKGDSVDLALADVWRRYAFTAGKAGLTEEAQTYALKAQQVFLDHGEYGMASLCLYERCIAYHSIGDTAHMAQLLGELDGLQGCQAAGHAVDDRDTLSLGGVEACGNKREGQSWLQG